ncbi:MAG: hypothetical protein ACRD2G_12135, partial [Terriglobia bacterium]
HYPNRNPQYSGDLTALGIGLADMGNEGPSPRPARLRRCVPARGVSPPFLHFAALHSVQDGRAPSPTGALASLLRSSPDGRSKSIRFWTQPEGEEQQTEVGSTA